MIPIQVGTAAFPAWVFGSLLLLFLLCVFVFLREPIGPCKFCLFGLFSALLSGLFAASFITGTMTVQKSGFQASGGIGVFLLVLWLFWRSVIPRFDSSPPSEVDATAQHRSASLRHLSVIRRLSRLFENRPVSQIALKRLRILVALSVCVISTLLVTQSVTASRSGLSITELQPFDTAGGATTHAFIAGEAREVDCSNLRVVVYALTTQWYVQPEAGEAALTKLGRTSRGRSCTWGTWTHTGTHYAVLLAKPPRDYRPDAALPTVQIAGGNVGASIVV